MEKVYQAFPDDSEAAVFYALAHLATTPPDRITRTNADEAAEILLRVVQEKYKSSRRDALPRACERRPGPRARVASDHSQVRPDRARQSARVAHADAHLHETR